MDDDDFGADADFLAALATTDARPNNASASSLAAQQQHQQQQQQQQQQKLRIQQPTPQRIQQPIPQRLDRPPTNSSASSAGTPSGAKIVQPTPQALPSRSSGSSILVSPRQKNNPVLEWVKSIPWEYSDIPADYVLGLTTCALFLSLKYHRLHPEYVYTRIRNLQGKYTLRVLLALVDIPNHEDALRELSKTSLVNNVTIILAWSAQEAARYLELYKSYEHAGPGAIRGQQASSYAERLVEFVTVPRAVNKADAVALVSTFGSLRNAINAEPEQVAAVGGWGERKVRGWCRVVEEPFRVKKAGGGGGSKKGKAAAGRAAASGGVAAQQPSSSSSSSKPGRTQIWNPNLVDEEETMAEATIEESRRMAASSGGQAGGGGASSSVDAGRKDEQLSDGIAAALARLREKG